MSENTAKATIGDGVGVALDSTPGDVSAVARTINRAIRSNADFWHHGQCQQRHHPGQRQCRRGLRLYTHTASASVGRGVRITARDIGVSANTDLPNENDWVRSWTDIASPADIFSHLNGTFGVVNNILTSYANASGATRAAQRSWSGQLLRRDQ